MPMTHGTDLPRLSSLVFETHTCMVFETHTCRTPVALSSMYFRQ